MAKRLIKIIRNEDGDITDYQVKQFVTARFKPRGGEYIYLEQDKSIKFPKVNEVDGKLVLVEDPEKVKIDDLKDLYDDMVTDIYDELENVFNTRSDISAAAFASTWEAMSKRPASYVDEELGFTSVQEVMAYAEAKLATADAYGKFRLKRLKKYQDDKDALLNQVD